mmetsp:Transcript_79329/g.242740  ORF Transcript_79329/g.242740 Transcript_79329/m.242740 type:complete len:276 (+) Transcript_79329:934-1761(+)
MHQGLEPHGQRRGAEDVVHEGLELLEVGEDGLLVQSLVLLVQGLRKLRDRLPGLPPEVRHGDRRVRLGEEHPRGHGLHDLLQHPLVLGKQRHDSIAEVRRRVLDLQHARSDPIQRGDQGALVHRPLPDPSLDQLERVVAREIRLGIPRLAHVRRPARVGQVRLPVAPRGRLRHLGLRLALGGLRHGRLRPRVYVRGAELGRDHPNLLFPAIHEEPSVDVLEVRPSLVQASLDVVAIDLPRRGLEAPHRDELGLLPVRLHARPDLLHEEGGSHRFL